MAEEQNNSEVNDSGDKNWKAMRTENEQLAKRVAEFEAKERTNVFKEAVSFPVVDPVTGVDVLNAFDDALLSGRPAMIIERKSRY